jgi:formylglycine-generating enzyme required for sulfatase activity
VEGPYLQRTCRVGSYDANALGLYDMHGNVCEWCADGKGEYEKKIIKDPKNQLNGSPRILRGGSWRSAPLGCRAAYRHDYYVGYRLDCCGFRVVLRPAPGTL